MIAAVVAWVLASAAIPAPSLRAALMLVFVNQVKSSRGCSESLRGWGVCDTDLFVERDDIEAEHVDVSIVDFLYEGYGFARFGSYVVVRVCH